MRKIGTGPGGTRENDRISLCKGAIDVLFRYGLTEREEVGFEIQRKNSNRKDRFGLLNAPESVDATAELDDEALLLELGAVPSEESDITKLKHVRTRAEVHAAEEIARRTPCLDFSKFKPLFSKVQDEIESGYRQTREFRQYAQIKVGEFFILGGQKIYVAEMGEEFVSEYDRPDRRLRLIYDNGTESDLLLRSLQRALNKDNAGRRITDPTLVGPLFTGIPEVSDTASGTVYVLRSKSEHPIVFKSRDVIHKIGVTSGDIKRRIATAKIDPTFLMAEVEIVASYELSNASRMVQSFVVVTTPT